MKIRHQEYLRLFLCCGYIASNFLSNYGDAEIIREINEYLEINNMDLNNIKTMFSLGYDVSLLSSFRLERLAVDYKELDSLYREVVCNIGELIEYLGFQDDSVKVFALFVYLYRNGYLSYNHKFMYSTNMKDLSSLAGLDVVRGTGVCRSIASMFTDVCNQVGLTAANLGVKVDSKSLAMKENLSEVDLEAEEIGAKFAKVVGCVTRFLPIGNHLVSLVHDENNAAVFDPTNDIFMRMDSFRRYSFINNTGAKMSYSFISNICSLMMGQMKTKLDVRYLTNISKLPVLSHEEYCRKYRETLELIKANRELFERFYEFNTELYNEIYEKSSEQHGMVKRLLPIVPSAKRNC